MSNNSQSLIGRIKDLKTIRGVRISHLLRREDITAIFEDPFKGNDADSDSTVTFYRDRKTGGILGIKETGGMHGRSPFSYAFLNSDGSVLPDPECVGIINGAQQKLQLCYEKLIEGYELIN